MEFQTAEVLLVAMVQSRQRLAGPSENGIKALNAIQPRDAKYSKHWKRSTKYVPLFSFGLSRPLVRCFRRRMGDLCKAKRSGGCLREVSWLNDVCLRIDPFTLPLRLAWVRFRESFPHSSRRTIAMLCSQHASGWFESETFPPFFAGGLPPNFATTSSKEADLP